MNDKGSVTVYALLLIVPILLFAGILLDVVRIHAAQNDAEQKVKAAVRSVLSAYDRTLRSHYGLFGLAASDAERSEIAEEVVAGEGPERLVSTGSSGNGNSIIRLRNESVTVNAIYPLADQRFFRRQILEEMKTKAPVEFTRNVFDKWKDHAPQMEEAEQQFEMSEQMEEWIQKREKRLGEAYDELEDMKDLIERGHAILSRPAPEREENIQEGKQNAGSSKKLEKAEEKPPENPYLDAAPIFSSLQNKLTLLRGSLQEAEKNEQQIVSLMDAEKEEGDLFKDIHILGHEYYLRYEMDTAIPVTLFGAAQSAAAADPYASIDFSFYSSFQSLFGAKNAEEQRRKAAMDELERKKEEAEKKTEERVNEVKSTLAKQVCSPSEEKQYVRLSGLYEKYLAYNSGLPAHSDSFQPSAALDQKPKELQKGSLSGLSSLSSVLSKIRDEAYVNEYVFMYFNNRLSDKAGEPLIAAVKQHLLQGQEAEYVLYGLSSCTANRAAAYAEIFTFRFAIRTIEALSDVRKAAVGSPLLLLLTAAAEGAVKAQADMNRLLEGEQLPVFGKMQALKMGYVDYLRSFMALHSNERAKMSRMQALIELNTGIDLEDRPVYIKGESKSKLKLWIWRGGNGSSWEIVKQAAMAY